jgi:hypothetical protein
MKRAERNRLRIAAWQEVADLTHPKCGTCPGQGPNRCCDRIYCDEATRWAKDKWGIELKPTGYHPELPFMGPEGCVVPPHLRPICAVHVCDSHYAHDGAFGQKYFDLRARLDDLEAGLEFDTEYQMRVLAERDDR